MASKVDYQKQLLPALKELCTKRGLSIKGKKEELIQRLVESDKEGIATESASTPAAAEAESSAAKTTSAAASSPAKPKPAPAQSTAAATDADADNTTKPAAAASTTSEKKTPATETTSTEPADTKIAAPTTESAKDKAPADPTEAPADSTEAPKPPSTDYSTGLPSTSADEELERRKKRMAKFGPVDSADTTDEASKTLARQKRFGGAADDAKDGDKAGLSRLDQALPERRKRGRGAEEGTGGAGGSFEDAGLKRRRGGGGGRGRGGRDRSSPRKEGKKAGGGVAEADRLAAEKRKERFTAK